jgi:hypothetical protein
MFGYFFGFILVVVERSKKALKTIYGYLKDIFK